MAMPMVRNSSAACHVIVWPGQYLDQCVCCQVSC